MFNFLRGKPAPDPLASPLWPDLGRRMPLLSGLDDEEWARLEDRMRHFLRTKSIRGVQGMELGERELLTIAAQACLPILALGDKAYEGWSDVLVYPTAFVSRDPWRDEQGLVHEGEQHMAGMARSDGPVLLSWPDSYRGPALDGSNLVIHEFAHKLDMLNGNADGYPPLHANMVQKDWTRAFTRGYEDLCRRLNWGEHTPIDPYAATNPAEFFAVLSEYFFELPHLLHTEYPAIYEQLRQFYRQDPGMRLPVIGVDEQLW
ncbi:M90 family metallopeptidase [Chitinimonas sp.]|uniref:M90 family metallopeptidase n=1 Tax=Chitinimonas sp. TaxID=1934313 RepID=UPI002F921B36